MYTAHTWSASTHLRNRTKTAFRIPSSILITRKEVAAQSVPKMNLDFRPEAWNDTKGQVIDFKRREGSNRPQKQNTASLRNSQFRSKWGRKQNHISMIFWST
jgi:hypothetical protein